MISGIRLIDDYKIDEMMKIISKCKNVNAVDLISIFLLPILDKVVDLTTPEMKKKSINKIDIKIHILDGKVVIVPSELKTIIKYKEIDGVVDKIVSTNKISELVEQYLGFKKSVEKEQSRSQSAFDKLKAE